MNDNLIKQLQEVKLSEDDFETRSGRVTAAHKPENCLLVWFYNMKSGELRADTNPNASHSDEDSNKLLNAALEDGTFSDWVRGRVYNYNGTACLIVYFPEKLRLSGIKLGDILYKCQGRVEPLITKFVDENGENIEDLFENFSPKKIVSSFQVEESKETK